MNTQIIERKGKPEYAVLPYEDYLQLLEDARMLADLRAYDQAKAALARGEDELVPADVVDRLLDGGNPVRVWREYRTLTQAQLGEAAGVSVSTVSYIESGARQPSVSVIKSIAGALRVDIDELV
ncbi:MAG: helix-turn-helix transcriptional regulator [Salinisphaera sp.]|nr:helix-turn-helix transcriptional regulator [Salinisphaera sp.]